MAGFHRDLKPANILLDAQDQPQVTDFGLAKRVDSQSGMTRSGDVVGTPGYMAPEQARGEKQLSTAVDVWALGAVFYELLAGQPPFRSDDWMVTLRQVVEDEPVKSHVINPSADRDLETICLKCLEKDPRKRYGSAETLADDIERWLKHEPITARPGSVLERGAKWVRRRPVVAALCAGLLSVAVLGFGLVTWQWQRAEAAVQTTFASKLAMSSQVLLSEPRLDAALLLAAHAVRLHDSRDNVKALRDCVAFPKCRVEFLKGSKSAATSVAFSPDGKTLAVGGGGGMLRLWDVATRLQLGAPLAGHKNGVRSVAFSPDGKTLASGGTDTTVRLWRIQDRWLEFARLLANATPKELIQNARQMANRELTDVEVKQYFGEFTNAYVPLWPDGNSAKNAAHQ